MMETTGCFGRKVRLTDERVMHIAEMRGMRDEIVRILQAPAEVRISRSDAARR